MLTSLGHCGRSTHVDMKLVVNGSVLSIGQMGADFLMLDDPIDHRPGEATIVFRVDDDERRWPVMLPNGVSTANDRVSISNV